MKSASNLVSQIEAGEVTPKTMHFYLEAALFQVLYERGASIREISFLTGFDRSTIARRLKDSVFLDAIFEAADRAADAIGAAIMVMVNIRIAGMPIIGDQKQWLKEKPWLEKWVNLANSLERHVKTEFYKPRSTGGFFPRKPKPKAIIEEEVLPVAATFLPAQMPALATKPIERRELQKEVTAFLARMDKHFQDTSNTCYSEYEVLKRFKQAWEYCTQNTTHLTNAFDAAFRGMSGQG